MTNLHLQQLRLIWSRPRKRLWQLKPGEAQDYRIIDEHNNVVWASEWCRTARKHTRPRGIPHGKPL